MARLIQRHGGPLTSYQCPRSFRIVACTLSPAVFRQSQASGCCLRQFRPISCHLNAKLGSHFRHLVRVLISDVQMSGHVNPSSTDSHTRKFLTRDSKKSSPISEDSMDAGAIHISNIPTSFPDSDSTLSSLDTLDPVNSEDEIVEIVEIAVGKSQSRVAAIGEWVDATLHTLQGIALGRVWPQLPILDTYILAEMVPVFFTAVGLCSILGMSLGALVGLLREVVASGLPLGVAGTAAMLQLPYFAALSMPMASLAASFFGLGRLQADMESVALFAAGVPLWRMFAAPLCLGVVAALLKLACYECLVPYSSSQARKTVDAVLTTHMQGLRQTEDLIYPEYGLKTVDKDVGDDDTSKDPLRRVLQRIWYATKLEGAHLSDVILLDVSPTGHVHRVVVAGEGEWRSKEGNLEFRNSTMLDVSSQGSIRHIIQVEGLQVPSAGLTPKAVLGVPSLQELSRRDIMLQMTDLCTKIQAKTTQGPNDRADLLPKQRDEWEEPLNHMKEEQKEQLATSGEMRRQWIQDTGNEEGKLVELRRVLHQRDAAVSSCVVYGLIGTAAILAHSRESRSGSQATAFALALLSIMVYNATMALAVATCSRGALSPLISAGMSFFVGLSLTLFLLHIH